MKRTRNSDMQHDKTKRPSIMTEKTKVKFKYGGPMKKITLCLEKIFINTLCKIIAEYAIVKYGCYKPIHRGLLPKKFYPDAQSLLALGASTRDSDTKDDLDNDDRPGVLDLTGCFEPSEDVSFDLMLPIDIDQSKFMCVSEIEHSDDGEGVGGHYSIYSFEDSFIARFQISGGAHIGSSSGWKSDGWCYSFKHKSESDIQHLEQEDNCLSKEDIDSYGFVLPELFKDLCNSSCANYCVIGSTTSGKLIWVSSNSGIRFDQKISKQMIKLIKPFVDFDDNQWLIIDDFM